MNVLTCGRWLLLLLALGLVQPAHAIVLYRADVRPPDIVFRDGFVAPGTNMDPLLHLTGANCFGAHGAAEWTSAYISMTDQQEDVINYGAYVYHVVPDENATGETATYDVTDGLMDIQRRWQLPGLTLRHRDAVASLVGQRAISGQHMTRRVVPESIEAVDIYEYDYVRNQAVFVRRENNPRFRAPANPGSQSSFSAEMIEGIRTGGHPSQMHLVVEPDNEERSVCLLPPSACLEATPNRMTIQATGLFPYPASCAVRPLASPGSLWQQALQLILD